MKLRVYAYTGCGTCRKALDFLRREGIPHEVIPIREQPPKPAELKAALRTMGGQLRRLFNTSGKDYRELGIKDRLDSMSPEEAIDLLAANGNLVKRPFVVRGRVAWAGFNEAEWRQRLGKAGK
ncbi:MAG: arsenate reductase family protein [Verrucomicrobia bacterium]|nr:MAG: arsenate reductase family protein [Verrucomicrobiota bacterium]